MSDQKTNEQTKQEDLKVYEVDVTYTVTKKVLVAAPGIIEAQLLAATAAERNEGWHDCTKGPPHHWLIGGAKHDPSDSPENVCSTYVWEGE